MKKVILMFAVVLAVVSCQNKVKNEVEVTEAKEVKVAKVAPSMVDVENSIVKWKGFKPTGEHFGTIAISKGFLDVNQDKLVGGSIVIDMNSIVVTDMPKDDEYNTKLVGHLKSPDFFDIEKYPTAKFEITKVIELDGKLNAIGNLTIKATTKSITIPVNFSNENGVSTLKAAVFTIDRSDFDVRYGSKKFFDNLKDKFINDEFELSFDVKTIKR